MADPLAADPVAPDRSAEADKLFRSARAARARIEAAQGAPLIAETGRICSAAAGWLPHFQMSAIEWAVAAAAAAPSLKSSVVVGAASQVSEADAAVFADLAESGATITAYRRDRSIVANWSAS